MVYKVHIISEMNRVFYENFKDHPLMKDKMEVYCYSDYNGRGWFKTENPQWSNFKHYRIVPNVGPNKKVWDMFLIDPSKVFISFNNGLNFFRMSNPEAEEAPTFLHNMVMYIVKEDE